MIKLINTINLYQNSYILGGTDLVKICLRYKLLSSCYSKPYTSPCLKSAYVYEIIQLMSTIYFRKQYILLVGLSLDLIAIITVTRIENYRDRFAKLISMDLEGRILVFS